MRVFPLAGFPFIMVVCSIAIAYCTEGGVRSYVRNDL